MAKLYKRMLVLIAVAISSTSPVKSSTENIPFSDSYFVGRTEFKSFYAYWPSNGTITWIKAQEVCNQAGGGMKLAALESDEEETLAKTFMTQQSDINPISFWLSATDFGSEGVFHWTKSGNRVGSKVTQSDTDYLYRNCLRIKVDGYFDEECSKYASQSTWPLCEVMESESPTTTTTTTESPVTSTSTARTTTATSTTAAPFVCPSEGKHPDPLRCNVFHECVKYQGGFVDYEITCPAFTIYCPKEEACDHPELCPCELESVSEVAEQLNHPEAKSYMPLSLSHPNAEKEDLILVGILDSKAFYTAKKPDINWIDSMQFCHSEGMMLARIETQEERNLAINFMNLQFNLDYFWLSGVDYGSEGEYYWINTGKAFNEGVYGNGGLHSNCLYLAAIGPTYDWACEDNHYYTLWPLCMEDFSSK